MEWYSRVAQAVLPPVKLHDTFAFVFHAWCRSSNGVAEGSSSSSAASSPAAAFTANGTLCNGSAACGKPEVPEHEASYQLCRTGV